MFKLCSTCKVEKLLTDFRKDKCQKDGYQHGCKICARAATKQLYTLKYAPRYVARNREREREVRELVREYKRKHNCVCCGETEPICLDFHHLDPSQKDFELSLVGGRGWNNVKSEIEKCILVCKNCHAKIHANIIDVTKTLTRGSFLW